MTAHRRNQLLETLYALDGLVWCYALEADRSPAAWLTPEDICLFDFSRRAGSIIRKLLNADTEGKGPRPRLRIPGPDDLRGFVHNLKIQQVQEANQKPPSQTFSTPLPSAPPEENADSDGAAQMLMNALFDAPEDSRSSSSFPTHLRPGLR